MNDKQAAQLRIDDLRKSIREANLAYFQHDEEIMPEAIRDQLKKELIALETQFPDLITDDSPTQRVGAPLQGKLPKIVHKNRKYSLADGFEKEDLDEFDARVKRFLKQENIEYSCEQKIDGLNITLWYKDGKLDKAITRGNGIEGEDVTHSIRTCKNIPLVLPQKIDLEVSGECLMLKKDFDAIKQTEEGKDYANARNLAAGSVRQLDPKVAETRELRMFLYELGENSLEKQPQSQKEFFTLCDELQLPHQSNLEVFTNIDDVFAYCETSGDQKQRDSIPYDIDGVVIKVHNFELRKRLGYTAKTAKFAIAWKFPAEEKYTKLEDVIYQVGRTGAITPVAVLTPVHIAGSMVARAILHNADEISRKDIRIGDTVIVRKAGDIIPEVVEPILNLRTGQTKKIEFPTECPACSHILDTSEIVARCENPQCPAQKEERFVYFGKTLKIDGLGRETIKALLEKDMLKNFGDLWRLDEHDLILLEGFKHKKVFNLLDSLLENKKLLFPTLLSALGIRFIGKENAKLLSHYMQDTFGEITLKELNEKIVDITLEDLLHIDGLGETVSQSFLFFVQHEAQNVFGDLAESEIEIEWPEKATENGKLQGKKIVITGSFEGFSRDELKSMVAKEGGKVLSAISANADYLFAGEKAGSKLKKAEELNIEVYNEEKICEVLDITLQKGEENQESLF